MLYILKVLRSTLCSILHMLSIWRNAKVNNFWVYTVIVTVLVLIALLLWVYVRNKCLSKPVPNTCLAHVHRAFSFRVIFSILICGDIQRLLFLVRNRRNLNSISHAPYYHRELYYALFGRYLCLVPTQAVRHIGPSCSVNVSSKAAKLLQGLREFT